MSLFSDVLVSVSLGNKNDVPDWFNVFFDFIVFNLKKSPVNQKFKYDVTVFIYVCYIVVSSM